MAADRKSGRDMIREASLTTPADLQPSANPPPPDVPPAGMQPGEMQFLPPGAKLEAPSFKAVLELPLGPIAEKIHISRHVDTQLSHAQARAMRSLIEGLRDSNAKLANGRRVTTSADVVRFILDQIGTR